MMRALADRFWSACGFGACRPPVMADRPGFADGYGCSTIMVQFTGWDRLRIIFSGKFCLQISHKVDVMPGRWESSHNASVLAPNHRMPS